MDVTFFIGNGFDINIGLKTGYRDFLKWYLKQPTTSSTIKQFKELISSDIETWSDLEKALGQKTTERPLDMPESFLECKTDLDLNLRRYLEIQNTYFPSPPFFEYCSQFEHSLIHFARFVEKIDSRAAINKIISKQSMRKRRYNIITFNFTNTVDLLWGKLPYALSGRENEVARKKNETFLAYIRRITQDVEDVDFKGEFIHVHGVLDNAMMTGVNDPGQIANPDFRDNEDVLECCVKPLMNQTCGNHVNEKVRKIIDRTNIFVVFGMSIGETDKMWWDQIVHHVLTDPNSYLLLVNYDPSYKRTLSYTARYTSKSMVANLYRVTEISIEDQRILNNRMDVLLNTKMFKLRTVPLFKGLRAIRDWFRKYRFVLLGVIVTLVLFALFELAIQNNYWELPWMDYIFTFLSGN